MSTQHSGTDDSHLSQYENAVFVSYKWGGESEEIVDQIQQAVQARGLKLIRDKRDLGFRGSIRKFMERMGRGTCVIVVINDGYLRSRHCMFELMEIAEAEQFHDRVFPVVLGDADIYDPIKIIGYLKHWEEKKAELTEAVKSVDQANLQGIRDEIDLYDHIRDEISGLISTLNDMNTLTPEMHQRGDYAILVDGIAERIGSTDSVQQETIRDRRLDAAMPNECRVGHTTEVRALIALPDSTGLKAFLPDYTISSELIEKGDVEGTGAPINFPHDLTTGRLFPAYLYVKIDAPGFKVGKPLQQILVPPDKDSGILTFFMLPNKPQSIGRVAVKLYQDKDCTIAIGSVTLTTKVNVQEEGRSERLWQLKALSLISADSVLTASQPDDDENRSPSRRARKKLSVEMQVALVGAIATIFAAIWATGLGSYVWQAVIRTPIPSTAIPACITADDILVKVHVLRENNEEIATLIPGATFFIEPGLTVYFKAEIISVDGITLPVPNCTWMNTGVATDGKLLHHTGCTIDYQAGLENISDSLSLELSQPSCITLPLYAFFISLKE